LRKGLIHDHHILLISQRLAPAKERNPHGVKVARVHCGGGDIARGREANNALVAERQDIR
jgi:hypothetical protein